MFQRDSLKNYTEEILTFKDKTIVKSTLNNQTFYSATIENVFFSSSSQLVVSNAFNKNINDTSYKQLFNTSIADKTASIIIKNSHGDFVTSLFPYNVIDLNNFTNNTAIDLDISQNKILINGVTQAQDSLNNFINIFRNTIPQENKIHENNTFKQ